MAKRVLIVAATTGYQTRVFEEAARSLGFEPVLATNRCDQLPDPWGDQAIPVRFEQPEASADRFAGERFDGVVAVGDRPAVTAAAIAERLGLRFHPRSAVEAAGDKFLAHQRFQAAGMRVPGFVRVPMDCDLRAAARDARYPCVLKPLTLSASRGVIRADNADDFCAAFARIRTILREHTATGQNDFIQIEEFIPGREFAVEGLILEGRLKVLAIFDKPDDLNGPFFEEAIYVTPSREPESVQSALEATTQQAVTALGLTNGPVHAELRYNEHGAWILEAAARPIGGLCAKSLRFSGGMSLEQLLLRFAAGEDVANAERETVASGVLMIPVPANGLYESVTGVDEAQNVPGITEVVITAKPGQALRRLPEGASYPGFLFARAATAQEVETALREAHARLRFHLLQELPAFHPQFSG